uniref:Uncharacterized protein n=1 Tax=Aegilops tauschii subsp. strangulata TaxID=200361 RepID=A0A453J9X9_AEGTS
MLSVGCPLLLKFYHHLVVLESRDGILSSQRPKPQRRWCCTPLYPSKSSASRLPNMNTSSICTSLNFAIARESRELFCCSYNLTLEDILLSF